MLSEIRHILEKNEDHVYILAVEFDKVNKSIDFESLKDILFIDIVKDCFENDLFYNIIGKSHSYEIIKEVVLRKLQYYKTETYLILAVKIENITSDNS